MIIFPAIDLKQGQCVRLLYGDMNNATTYSQDPVAQAQFFVENGASYLHVVDLDAAISGGGDANSQAIIDIVKNVAIPVQVGGGIRNMPQLEKWIESGVGRVILGTAAVKNPDFVREACQKFPDKIVLALDAKNDKVALEGWVELSDRDVFDLAVEFADAGAAAIIYTDINRDGALLGPNLWAIEEMINKTDIPVIASGGIARLGDIANLAKIPKVEGVICGRALYDEKFSLKEAIEVAQQVDA